MHRARHTIATTSLCLALACLVALPDPAAAQELVRVTPLGGVEGEFWRLRIPTGPASGQQRLARGHVRVKGAKRPPEWTETLIRPSLITEVTPHGKH